VLASGNLALLGAFLPEISVSAHCLPDHAQAPICIVGDDEAVADLLKALLETSGFDAQSYGSGNEFLADERRRRAGCLTLGQHMPGFSGRDVVEKLHKEGIQIPTILLSGRLDASTGDRASRLGVRELLDKPVAASGVGRR
jgi:two-component system response regulator FixJ